MLSAGGAKKGSGVLLCGFEATCAQKDRHYGTEANGTQIDQNVGQGVPGLAQNSSVCIPDFESAIQQTLSTSGGGGRASTQQQSKTGNQPQGQRKPARGKGKPGSVVITPATKPAAPVSGAAPTGSTTSPSGQARKCFKCGDLTHGVFQCPLANATEAKELYEKHRKSSKSVGAVVQSSKLPAVQVQASAGASAVPRKGPLPCLVNGVVEAMAKPDCGAEVSVVTPRLLHELTAKGQWLQCRELNQQESIEGITAAPMIIKQEVKLDLRFDTANGGLTLKNLTCWVVSGGLPAGMGNILLSESVMERLGYNAQSPLDNARTISGIFDMDAEVPSTGMRRVLAYATATNDPDPIPEEKELQADEDQACFPEVDINQDREEARALEWSTLEAKLDEAAKLGCSPAFRVDLAKILFEYRDVFRMKLGRDPPVDMAPLKVTLKPDAVPVKCKARRYPPEHRQFMKKHIAELIDAKLCYRNPHS